MKMHQRLEASAGVTLCPRLASTPLIGLCRQSPSLLAWQFTFACPNLWFSGGYAQGGMLPSPRSHMSQGQRLNTTLSGVSDSPPQL